MKRWCIGWAICCWGLASVVGQTPAFKATPDEINVFDLTNQERKKEKTPELKLNPALSKIARAHPENILEPGFTEIGVGIAHDKNGQVYYTQLFARPRK